MTWITATVQNDLCPIFSESFRVPLWTLPTKGDPTKQLVLEAMDEDDYLGLKCDFLGKVELDMASLIAECEAASKTDGPPLLKKSFPLLEENGGNLGTRGSIELHFLWRSHKISEKQRQRQQLIAEHGFERRTTEADLMEMMSASDILKLMQTDSADSGPAHEADQSVVAANPAAHQQPGFQQQQASLVPGAPLKAPAVGFDPLAPSQAPAHVMTDFEALAASGVVVQEKFRGKTSPLHSDRLMSEDRLQEDEPFRLGTGGDLDFDAAVAGGTRFLI
jgi:hypothetical protein